MLAKMSRLKTKDCRTRL